MDSPITAFHVMTKPIGPLCNLNCTYCFYLEKEKLFAGNSNFRMSDTVLDAYIRQYIENQSVPEIHFAWQGGEPTLLGVDFFRKVVQTQKKYAQGKTIHNAFQTNGTLIDDEWAAFFAENHFLVGLSIDGPKELHEAYRVDKKGDGSFDRVLCGLQFLKQHRVEFNTLTVVNRLNSRKPLEVYRFLKEIGSGFMQFIPLVERAADEKAAQLGLNLAMPPRSDEHDASPSLVTPWSVEPETYGEFLVSIFDEWVKQDVGRYFVQLFDVTLCNWVGAPGSLCVFNETCGGAMAIEHNGDVFSCDHYVYPQYKIGNVLNKSLGAMAGSERQRQFGQNKRDSLPKYCFDCDVRFLCHGECPKYRFARTPDGEPGLNYLCQAYKRFFHHSMPAMRTMRDLLRARRSPADVMKLAK